MMRTAFLVSDAIGQKIRQDSPPQEVKPVTKVRNAT